MREGINPGLVTGLSELQSDYFFFFAAVFFFAGAFFFAFDAVFFFAGAFFFTGISASLVNGWFFFPTPLITGTFPQQPPTSSSDRIIWSHFRHVNRRMPFWKYFFEAGIVMPDEKNRPSKMLLDYSALSV